MRLIVTIMALSICAPVHAVDWTTHYEDSGGKRTPNYQQTVDYCERLAAASPWIHFTSFGMSPRGRELPLVILDRNGNFDPSSVHASGNAVVLIQAGIHSGEIDGKDAGLMLARDIAITREKAELINDVTVLFIPIFNVDGHERTSRYNRANQNGPEEMGWRATATNLNLNRDYLKADTAEMQAWLRLFTAWLPDFFVDCHVTDGADYQYVVTYGAEVQGSMEEGLTDWMTDRFLAPLIERMAADGLPMGLYQWYRRHNDPRSGLRSFAATPRLSEGYTAIQNRPGLLVETHSLKDYKTRVEGTYAILLHTLVLLNEEHEDIRERVARADELTASPEFRSTPYPVRFRMSTKDSVMIDHLGIDYEVVQSELMDAPWLRFNGRPIEYQIPYFHTQEVVDSARLPDAYVIPPEWTEVIERLKLHGVELRRLNEPVGSGTSTYRFADVQWEQAPYEGRHPATFSAELLDRQKVWPAGSAVVDMNQRAARVAANILEPMAVDSYVYWGFFDPIFERKEYVESYVAEEMAREMIAADSTVLDEFDAWKEANPNADAWAKRFWFYRRSPYWDSEKNVYPVGRLDAANARRLLSHCD